MTLVLLLASLAALTAVAIVRRTAWANRGIRLGLPYPLLAGLQLAAALPAGLLVADRISTAAGVATAAFTWLAVLTVASDLASHLLPREACNATTLIGLPCLAVSWSVPAAFGLAFCFVGLVAVPWLARVLTRRGLGFGDIRLLTAATATLSWWVGQDALLYALIAACGIQILIRVITWPWRNRVGIPEPRNADDTTPRRALPFGPALALSLLSAATYVTVTGYDVCAAWALAATC